MKATAKMLCAIACGFAIAASAHAADMTTNKKGPTSSNESAPAEDTLKKKGKSGKAAIPSKGPSASNESAPSKKERNAPLVNDSKNTPNPKSPSSSNESAPSKSR